MALVKPTPSRYLALSTPISPAPLRSVDILPTKAPFCSRSKLPASHHRLKIGTLLGSLVLMAKRNVMESAEEGDDPCIGKREEQRLRSRNHLGYRSVSPRNAEPAYMVRSNSVRTIRRRLNLRHKIALPRRSRPLVALSLKDLGAAALPLLQQSGVEYVKATDMRFRFSERKSAAAPKRSPVKFVSPKKARLQLEPLPISRRMVHPIPDSCVHSETFSELLRCKPSFTGGMRNSASLDTREPARNLVRSVLPRGLIPELTAARSFNEVVRKQRCVDRHGRSPMLLPKPETVNKIRNGSTSTRNRIILTPPQVMPMA